MRIALVSSGYAPNIGGLEQVTRALAHEWKQKGHDVRVVTNRSSRKLLPREVIDGTPVYRGYFVWGFSGFGIKSWLKWFAQCALFPNALWTLWTELNPSHVDVVHLHYIGPLAWLGALTARMRSLPVIATVHGSDLLGDGSASPSARFVFRSTLKFSCRITTVSRFMMRELEKMIPQTRGNVAVISNGFDDSTLRRVEAHPSKRPYGICVGRFIRQKRQALLVAALDFMGPDDPGFDFIFVGDGPMLAGAKALVDKSSVRDHILFRGALERSETLSLVKGASFVAIASEYESFCLVALEARFFSRPVVTFRRGALPEVLEDYPGAVWAERETAESLARGMKETMRLGAITDVQPTPFSSWAEIADAYIKLFTETLAAQKP